MKKLIFLLFVTTFTFGQEQMKKIKGQVTYMDTPLVQAEVKHVATGDMVMTTMDGQYEIMAAPGDILQYSYPSMRTLEVVVEDVTRILNISLNPEVNELDEVVVTKRRTQSQSDLELQFRTNKNLIRTAFGIVDTKISPYRIPTLDGENFILNGVDLFTALNGKFAGVTSISNGGGSGTVFLRGGGSIMNPRPAIFDVDGQIFSDPPLWLFPENIERLAIIPGLVGMTKYGEQGAGGVVVVNTKVSNYGIDPETQAPYDYAKLNSNIYDGGALSYTDVLKNAPTYYQDLQAAKSVAEAMKVFDTYLTAYRYSAPFILDTFKKLNNDLQDEAAGSALLDKYGDVLWGNPVSVKALAYMYQANGQYQEANEVYKDIFILRPNYGQSYLDMANSYREIREYQKAAAIYGRYGYLVEQGFLRAEGDLGTIMDRELNNLVSLEGDKLLDRRELKKLVVDDEFQGTRIVFEWNDSEAEFELQFVNPKGQYYKTEYSLISSPERVKASKLSGFSTEEYLVDETVQGMWQVNATYLGNKSLTPTYLKATVYHNFGSPAQRKETKVIKLFLKNVNQQLFTVSNSVGVASN